MQLKMRYFIIFFILMLILISASAKNEKNMGMYSDGQVFMISDSDWRNVLSLVPLTTWTDLSTGEIHKYPTLVYKEQKESPVLNLKTVESDLGKEGEYGLSYPYGNGPFGTSIILSFKIDGVIADNSAGISKVSYGSKYWNEHCPGDGSTKVLVLNQFFEPEYPKFGDSVTLHVLFASCDGKEHVLNSFEFYSWPYSDFLNFESSLQEVTIPAGGQQGFTAYFKYSKPLELGFDADSSLHFLSQYKEANPNIKVTAVLDTPQELLDLASAQGVPVEKLDEPWKYLSYWSNIDSVFVVDYADYSSGLVASVAASYLNAPLFFVNKDNVDIFKYVVKNRVVLAVGNLDSETKSKLSAAASKYYAIPFADLQKISAQVSGSDKLLMVNPTDLQEIGVIVEPEKSSGVVAGYTSASLAAPFLAAAKHEVLIPIYSSDYKSVDAELDWRINYLGGADKFKYLTIMATPTAIETDATGLPNSIGACNADTIYYANTSNNNLEENNINPVLEFAVGRIYGITLTDVFSYVARDLFYTPAMASNKAIIIHGTDVSLEMKGTAKSSELLLTELGLDVESVYLDEDEDGYPYEELPPASFLEGVSFAGFFDHGGTDGWYGAYYSSDFQEEDVWFKPSIFLSIACSTCAFYSYGDEKDKLFCAQVLRRGDLAHFGSIAPSGSFLPDLLVSDIYSGLPLGKAFKNNFENLYQSSGPYVDLSDFLLLGDPTLVFNDGSSFAGIDTFSYSQKLSPDKITLTLHMPKTSIITNATYSEEWDGGTQIKVRNDTIYKEPPKTTTEPFLYSKRDYYENTQPPLFLYSDFLDKFDCGNSVSFTLPPGKKLGELLSFTIKTGSQISNFTFKEEDYGGPVCPDPFNSHYQTPCSTYSYSLQGLKGLKVKTHCGSEENDICFEEILGYVGVYTEAIDGKHFVHYRTPNLLFPEEEGAFAPDEFPDYAPARDIIMEIELVNG